jgi:hypothetical protein
MTRLATITLFAALLAALQGCTTASTYIRGKVVVGERSFIGVVEASDPRLKSVGLAEADVQVTSTSGPAAGSMIGQARTDAKGDFSIGVENQQTLIYPAQFRASGPGYAEARQTMSVPPSERRVLIILRPSAGNN